MAFCLRSQRPSQPTLFNVRLFFLLFKLTAPFWAFAGSDTPPLPYCAHRGLYSAGSSLKTTPSFAVSSCQHFCFRFWLPTGAFVVCRALFLFRSPSFRQLFYRSCKNSKTPPELTGHVSGTGPRLAVFCGTLENVFERGEAARSSISGFLSSSVKFYDDY